MVIWRGAEKDALMRQREFAASRKIQRDEAITGLAAKGLIASVISKRVGCGAATVVKVCAAAGVTLVKKTDFSLPIPCNHRERTPSRPDPSQAWL